MHARSYNTKQQLLHAMLLRCRIAMETHFSWDHEGEWNRDRTKQKVHGSRQTTYRTAVQIRIQSSIAGGHSTGAGTLRIFAWEEARSHCVFLLLFISEDLCILWIKILGSFAARPAPSPSPVSSLVLHLPATGPARLPRGCRLPSCRLWRTGTEGGAHGHPFFLPPSPAPRGRAAAGPGDAATAAAAPRALSACPGRGASAKHTAAKSSHSRVCIHTYIYICICTQMYVCVCLYISGLTGIQPLLLCFRSTHSSLLNPKWFNQNDVYPT